MLAGFRQQKFFDILTSSARCGRRMAGSEAPAERKYKHLKFNYYENLDYRAKQLWTEQFNWFVNYANTFGKHDVNAMVVFEQASNGGEWIQAKGEQPLSNLDQMFNYSSDAERRWGDACLLYTSDAADE